MVALELEVEEDLTRLLVDEANAVQSFPEKRLLAAVLARAILDLLVEDERSKAISSSTADQKFQIKVKSESKEEAIEWFISDHDHERFSFNWICDGLGFNSCCLRKRITRFLVHRPEAQSALAILRQMMGKEYADV